MGFQVSDGSLIQMITKMNVTTLGVNKLSLKHQIVNILGFAGYPIFVSSIALCSCTAKAVQEHTNKWVWLGSDKTLFTKMDCRWTSSSQM
jgi:hypothetical protein